MESRRDRKGGETMKSIIDKYEVIRNAERISATLKSIGNGDSAENGEFALFISDSTINELVESAEMVTQYLIDVSRLTEVFEVSQMKQERKLLRGIKRKY